MPGAHSMFKFFRGPSTDMAGLTPEEVACTLCGTVQQCFQLDCALCPELSEEQKPTALGCLSCLQKGRFEFWHDTEIGLLIENGLTHVYNHHQPPHPGFPEDSLLELRRTPRIITWQQELWLTHCTDFMTYLGTWQPGDFYSHAPDGDGRNLFLQMTDPEMAELWDASLPKPQTRLASWHATYYTFQCLHCGKLRGNWDCD
jgi:uncharacterized protein CbrC (UPF0167 family)